MPSTRPTVDPVLDILEEMGYDFDELEGDGYKRSIREALFKTHPDTGGKTADPEKFKILNDEFKKVRRGGDKPSGVEAKEKKTTIKADKLLPGRGKFNPNDISSEESESEAKVGESVGKNKFVDFLNSEVKSRLDNINSSLGNILKLLKDREASAEERDDDMREAINASKKSSREDKLEGKKGFKDKLKDKVMGQVEKTAGNFFMKVLKFALFTWLGSSLSRLITLIKDPAVLLDPIKKFFNAFISFQNFIMKAMWSITGKPINDIIKGIETGANFVIDSINKATSLLFIPPIPSVKLPKIPGPFQIPLIPLSKTAQAASGGGIDTKGTPLQGASDGGIVAGKDGIDGVDGLDAVQGRDGPTRSEMKGESKGKNKNTYERFGSDSITIQKFNTGGQVGAPVMEGGSGFNFLNPMSWIGGQAQGAIGQADRGEGEFGGGLAGQMMEKRRALAEAQGLSGGGTIDAKNISAAGGGKVESNSGIKIKGMGADTQLLAAKPGESVLQPGVREQILKDTGTDVLAYNKGPNANRPTVSNTNNITAASTGGTVTTISNRDRSNRITAASTGGIVKDRTSITPKVTRMNVGGLVPAPYPEGDNILNSFPMMMGYRGGGDVVDAKLTPGEIVMNKEQQKKMFQRTGVDPASFVPPAQPGKVKFATGGKVAPGANISPPGKKGDRVIINAGNKTPSPVASGGSGGDIVPKISSIDSENLIIPVVKSIYNIMG